MSKGTRYLTLAGLSAWVSLAAAAGKTPPASWHGIVRDEAGRPLASAVVELQVASVEGSKDPAGHPTLTTFKTISDEKGNFEFGQLPAGRYSVVVRWRGRTAGPAALEFGEGERLSAALEASFDRGQLVLRAAAGAPESRSSGGERLSSSEVSSLPLNKRDFSQLLLLAAGTMTDTNGAANFTQQFAVNGQRGTTAVFAIDGIYASDPELGGATFANFNVDAIQEVQSSSGAMPRASRTSSPSPARRRCMGLSSNSSATPGSMPAISSTGAPRRARAASRPSRATSLDSRMAARLSSRASIAAANALSISASTRVSGKCSAPRRSSPSPQPPNARGWTLRLSPVTRSSSRSALRSRRRWRVILCRTTRKGPTVRGRSLLPPRWRPSATSSRSGLITVFRRRANFSRALTSTTSPAPPPTPARPPSTPASASGFSTASGISV